MQPGFRHQNTQKMSESIPRSQLLQSRPQTNLFSRILSYIPHIRSDLQASTTSTQTNATPDLLNDDPPPRLNIFSPSSSTSNKKHLIVLVHGLFGSRSNWEVIHKHLTNQLPPEPTLFLISHSNEFHLTYQGISSCGKRLTTEITSTVSTHPSLQRISFISHSMGGLISRYAIGALYDPTSGSIAGLAPSHYISMATPHLGCECEDNNSPAQVPLIQWTTNVPVLGAVASVITRNAAAPVSEMLFKTAGQQFFLSDGDYNDDDDNCGDNNGGEEEERRGEEGRHTQQEQEGETQRRSNSSSSSSSRHRHHHHPLLYRLATDNNKDSLPFLSALRAFETRTCYANKSGDHLVGWANASLRTVDQLPIDILGDIKGKGVVLEDPIELAWHPDKRKQYSFGNSNNNSNNDDDGKGDKEVEKHHHRVLASIDKLETASSLEQYTDTGIDKGEAPDLMTAAASDGGDGDGSNIEEKSRAEYQREILQNLQTLCWRRVDVCFAAAQTPYLAHQHMQTQRPIINSVGEATAKHVAVTMKAMEDVMMCVSEKD